MKLEIRDQPSEAGDGPERYFVGVDGYNIENQKLKH
jgi:hypothetical protein